MSVTITWSNTNGGVSISSKGHGTGSAGDTLSANTLFIRHSGINSISQCRFYLATTSGSSATYLTEILQWGDATTAADFGGLQLNMDANGGFPSIWPTIYSKFGTNYNVFRTGVGDSSTNGILLPQAMGLTGSPGIIQAGDAPNVSFQCRIQIPSSVVDTGSRWFDQRMRFSYTS